MKELEPKKNPLSVFQPNPFSDKVVWERSQKAEWTQKVPKGLQLKRHLTIKGKAKYAEAEGSPDTYLGPSGSTQHTWIFPKMSLSHRLSRLMIPFFTSRNLLATAKFNKNFFKGVLASFCTCRVTTPLSWKPIGYSPKPFINKQEIVPPSIKRKWLLFTHWHAEQWWKFMLTKKWTSYTQTTSSSKFLVLSKQPWQLIQHVPKR